MIRVSSKAPRGSRHFTEDEIKEILNHIMAEAKRDSQFDVVKFLNGTEGVAVLQDGVNRKVDIKAVADYIGREIAPVIAAALSLQKDAIDGHFSADRKFVHDEVIPLLRQIIKQYGPQFKKLIDLIVKLYEELDTDLTTIEANTTTIISDIKSRADEIDTQLNTIYSYLENKIYDYLKNTIYNYLENTIYNYLSSSDDGYLQSILSSLFSTSLASSVSTLELYISDSVTTITNYFDTTVAVSAITGSQIDAIFDGSDEE